MRVDARRGWTLHIVISVLDMSKGGAPRHKSPPLSVALDCLASTHPARDTLSMLTTLAPACFRCLRVIQPLQSVSLIAGPSVIAPATRAGAGNSGPSRRVHPSAARYISKEHSSGRQDGNSSSTSIKTSYGTTNTQENVGFMEDAPTDIGELDTLGAEDHLQSNADAHADAVAEGGPAGAGPSNTVSLCSSHGR